MKDFAWVTQINGEDVYRSLTNPKLEVDSRGKKLKKKIKVLNNDIRPKNPKKNRKVK